MVTTATYDDLALTAVGSHRVETVEPWATGPAKAHTLIDVWKEEEAMEKPTGRRKGERGMKPERERGNTGRRKGERGMKPEREGEHRNW